MDQATIGGTGVMEMEISDSENMDVGQMRNILAKYTKITEKMRKEMEVMQKKLEKLGEEKKLEDVDSSISQSSCSKCSACLEVLSILMSSKPELSLSLRPELQKLLKTPTVDMLVSPSFVGGNPFLIACLNGDTDRAIELLEEGHKLDETQYNGWTAIHLAARGGHMKCLKMLVDRGVDVDCPTTWKHTPLHIAAYWGRNDCIEYLLEEDALINATNSFLQTPLHWAAKKNNAHDTGSKVKAIHLLIKNDADIFAKDRNGHTPVDVAQDEEWETLHRLQQEPMNKKIKIEQV